jgi:hypothetical protein
VIICPAELEEDDVLALQYQQAKKKYLDTKKGKDLLVLTARHLTTMQQLSL